MILEFWQTFLYQPLFNVLIWIYANLTDQNLGWAIVYLTILLRLVLLPLTIKSERNKSKNTLVAKEIIQLDKDFAKDHVLKKEEIRKKWLLIDAEKAVLGRLAVISANILRGKIDRQKF